MRRRIRRTRQVREDLVAIYIHVHGKSPQNAEKVLDALERSITSLLDTPGIGRLWESPDPRLEGLRVAVSTPYRNFLIFFRPVADGIEVFRVIHGARELDRIVDEILIDLEDVD